MATREPERWGLPELRPLLAHGASPRGSLGPGAGRQGARRAARPRLRAAGRRRRPAPSTCSPTGSCSPTRRWPTRWRRRAVVRQVLERVDPPQVAPSQGASRSSAPGRASRERQRESAVRLAGRAPARPRCRRPRSPRRPRCAGSRCRSSAGSTGCCRATTSATCPARAPSRPRRARTAPATTSGASTGPSPPARGEPHVRQAVAERELETTLLVDLTPSMSFGTARSEKRDVAIALAAAVGHLGERTGRPARRGRAVRRGPPAAAARRAGRRCSRCCTC